MSEPANTAEIALLQKQHELHIESLTSIVNSLKDNIDSVKNDNKQMLDQLQSSNVQELTKTVSNLEANLSR